MKAVLRSTTLGKCLAGGLLWLSAFAASALPEPLETPVGRLINPVQSDDVLAYRGIPYAQPPVGERRWKAPEPLAPWQGTRDASQFGDVCIQPPGEGRLNIAVLPSSPSMSEDCLSLNVWTPAQQSDQALPVMVYVYGGAFNEGAGSVPLYDGTALARQGAVVVTLNYRLGAFGFFTHPALSAESPEGSSGNWGLLDMIAALRWVQDNITAFGGDAGNVTVFGQSAGAMAISALLTSPLSEGLFQRAISQSGAWMGLAMGAMTQLARAEAQGQDAAEQLSAKTADDLRALEAEVVASRLRGSGMIVDGHVLPQDPSLVYAAGEQHRVDVLVGSNTEEGSFLPPGQPEDALKAFSDGTSWHMRLFADYMANQDNRAWGYLFARRPPTADGVRVLGATHAAEVPYVFNNLGELPLYPDASDPALASASAEDRALAERMAAYWVNFARHGDPNGEGLPYWPPYEHRGSPMMVLDLETSPEAQVALETWSRLDRDYSELLEGLQAQTQR